MDKPEFSDEELPRGEMAAESQLTLVDVQHICAMFHEYGFHVDPTFDEKREIRQDVHAGGYWQKFKKSDHTVYLHYDPQGDFRYVEIFYATWKKDQPTDEDHRQATASCADLRNLFESTGEYYAGVASSLPITQDGKTWYRFIVTMRIK